MLQRSSLGEFGATPTGAARAKNVSEIMEIHGITWIAIVRPSLSIISSPRRRLRGQDQQEGSLHVSALRYSGLSAGRN